MTDLRIPALAVLGFVACSSAWAAGPLEEWDMTVKMADGAQGMPEQRMTICQKRRDTAAPPLQSNCKYTSLVGTPARGSFVMECTGEHPSTIKGDGSQTATTMEGTMTIITSGVEIKQIYTGKRTGSCLVEGTKMVGSAGIPGGNPMAAFDPRGRVPPASSTDPTLATPGGAPPVPTPASVDDKPKSVADKAKKALKSLLPF